MALNIKPDEIITFENGYKYYWPTGCNGAFSAHTLREIAEMLDQQNEAWDNQVKEYFKNADKRNGQMGQGYW